MEKIIALCGDDGNLKVFKLELEKEDADLKAVMKEAALDYCRTQEGRRLFLDKGGLTYEDFISYVPDGYGIRKVDSISPDLVVGSSEGVLSGGDVLLLMEGSGRETERKWSVCTVAVQLGILWGVFQTLDGQDSLNRYGKDVDVLMAWAEEFVSERYNQPNFFLEDFFTEKINGMKKGGKYGSG